MVFAIYALDGIFPPTVVVDSKWWDLYDTEVVSEVEAVTALLGLIPSYATIP